MKPEKRSCSRFFISGKVKSVQMHLNIDIFLLLNFVANTFAFRTEFRRFSFTKYLSDKSGDASIMTDSYQQKFDNVARLYGGYKSLQRLWNSHCLIIGLGGVGSWSCEALARSGVREFTLIDMDDICVSNINRQIQCLTSTVGKFKAEVLKDRILDINPDAIVHVSLDFVRPHNVDSIIFLNGSEYPHFDFVIDAADGVSDKAVSNSLLSAQHH